MGRKCSVFGCNSGYLNDPYDGSVFSFPPEGSPERKMWLQSLPNQLKLEEVTDEMGVCDLHFLMNCKLKKVKRWWVLDEPPSIFESVPSSCTPQMTVKVSRQVKGRGVTAEERQARVATIETSRKKSLDKFADWSSLKKYCKGLDLLFSESSEGITLFCLSGGNPPLVKFSVSISPSFTVTCFVNKTKIPVAHLIDSFSHKLEKRSQLQNVISCEATPDAIQELRGIANDLKMFTETLRTENDEKIVRLNIMMWQLTLNSYEPNGRRYNSKDFKTAIELYLRSRSAYRELRIKFVLPHPKRIKSLFGVMDTVGSVNECRETTDILFQKVGRYPKILQDIS